jgi:excisionase family DNA binding protein
VSEVASRLGVHRCTIYRKVKERKFPRLVRITDGRSGFLRSEIEDWVAKRIAARDQSEAA